MPARGIAVSHEAIRLWTLRFGTEYARRLRCTRGKCSNIWHLDELCLMINGERGWLWRAVDDAGDILDILVQRRRSALAAKRFFRKLVKGLRMVPYAIVRRGHVLIQRLPPDGANNLTTPAPIRSGRSPLTARSPSPVIDSAVWPGRRKRLARRNQRARNQVRFAARPHEGRKCPRRAIVRVRNRLSGLRGDLR